MLYYKTYEQEENKEWVVFIHGAGGSSNIWFRQIKYFQPHFNILLIDLRGHGKSAGKTDEAFSRKYTFKMIVEDVMEVLDHLKIAKSHLIGISLGTIIIRHLSVMYPERVASMILGGAITHFNTESRFWVGIGNAFKHVLPFIWLYKIFAFVMMPRKTHAESRNVFIQEARRLARKEFLRWFKLTNQVTGLLKRLQSWHPEIPTLYVMGEEDRLFLQPILDFIDDVKHVDLHIIKKCGHVVNVEKPAEFNEVSVQFLLGNRPVTVIA
ncbi:MAG: alpha/beta hydrolase [Saprospiraceae bacterium]|nr:alpha/beta hydrolase [Saprospiraceae bacterium]